ncbi:chemotaxis protein CheX [Niallia sp. Krafla_26]|uniref:chemotaxis protein CheX n=1 Tax=Niallia sp. Krafla_26 TaxID=3064703 RepID=UPI003D16A76B
MSEVIADRSGMISELVTSTNHAIKTILPFRYHLNKPKQLGTNVNLQFGALIGITGQIQARFVLMGPPATFSRIAKLMFNMELDDDMIVSFTGELGNMLAGGISTHILHSGIRTDITAPTIMKGNTMLTGYEKAIHISVEFSHEDKLEICLLLD